MQSYAPGSVVIYTMGSGSDRWSAQRDRWSIQRDLYRISAHDGGLQLVAPNLAGPGMAALSRSGKRLAAVVLDGQNTRLRVFSADFLARPEAVVEVPHGIHPGKGTDTDPELKISADGSLVLLSDPTLNVTYRFARTNEWHPQVIPGVLLGCNARVAGGQSSYWSREPGSIVEGPRSLNDDVLMAACYGSLAKVKPWGDRVRRLIGGAKLDGVEHYATKWPAGVDMSKLEMHA